MTTHHSPTPPCDYHPGEALLTVVIPVYNRAHQVKDTLDSIIAGDVPALHIVAVDNNSTDNSLQVLEEWKNQHMHVPGLEISIVTEKTQGAAAARNRGLREVKTQWVEFFDSDDTMTPGHIPAVIKAISANPGKDILMWSARIRLLSGKLISAKTFSSQDLLTEQIIHCPLATCNYAVRTSVFRNAGGWNNNLRVWDDWETGVRLLLHNPGITMIDTPGVDVEQQEESITGTSFSTRIGVWEQAIDAVCQDIEESYLSRDAKEQALFACNYRRTILAAEYHRENANRAAEELLDIALKSCASGKKKMMLRWAYLHTRLGLRGAWTIMKKLKLC